MKVPQSIRKLYSEILPTYEALKEKIDSTFRDIKNPRWHYESRLKKEQSFALKLETGREWNPGAPEDFLGTTLVVENRGRIDEAASLVGDHFSIKERRPKDPTKTSMLPQSFDFDDLRLYVTLKDDPARKSTLLHSLKFEVQIKTFLQHAWGIATHDLVYKSEGVQWGTSRVAYQVKAMLENAELCIGEAQRLTDSSMLNRVDRSTLHILDMIAKIKLRWASEALPTDLVRLAQNIDNLGYAFGLSNADEIWAALDAATANGRGSKTQNLSPYAATLESLIEAKGTDSFKALGTAKSRDRIFVPSEIDLPKLPHEVFKRLIRP